MRMRAIGPHRPAGLPAPHLAKWVYPVFQQRQDAGHGRAAKNKETHAMGAKIKKGGESRGVRGPHCRGKRGFKVPGRSLLLRKPAN